MLPLNKNTILVYLLQIYLKYGKWTLCGRKSITAAVPLMFDIDNYI